MPRKLKASRALQTHRTNPLRPDRASPDGSRQESSAALGRTPGRSRPSFHPASHRRPNSSASSRPQSRLPQRATSPPRTEPPRSRCRQACRTPPGILLQSKAHPVSVGNQRTRLCRQISIPHPINERGAQHDTLTSIQVRRVQESRVGAREVGTDRKDQPNRISVHPTLLSATRPLLE